MTPEQREEIEELERQIAALLKGRKGSIVGAVLIAIVGDYILSHPEPIRPTVIALLLEGFDALVAAGELVDAPPAWLTPPPKQQH